MFCQKEQIDYVLGNHKGARDHLVSRFLFTLNEFNRSSLSEVYVKKLPSFVF